jgi:hypothetical protein
VALDLIPGIRVVDLGCRIMGLARAMAIHKSYRE